MPAEAIPFKASSHITGIAFDSETNDLVVTFNGGKSYLYSNVPAQVANGFTDAPSAGQYLETAIKGVYPYKKL